MRLDPNGMCDAQAGSRLWMLVHDGIAHPLLVLGFYSRPVVWFHDWTSLRAWPPGTPGTTRAERTGRAAP
jgi:hypothetical protein